MSEATPGVPEILAALRHAHRNYGAANRWAFFDELRIGTGYGTGSEQRMDAFAIALWPSKGWASYAYEIKVNRPDFRKEIRDPMKRRAGLRFSNLFYFATPEGLVKPEEVPIDCGLIEVRPIKVQPMVPKPGWEVHVVVHAPWRDIPPPTWNLFASVARRVQHAEQEQEKALA